MIESNDKGFTLIELLVVIVLVGILSAIALPTFLNQTSKAKQAEAKSTLGSINTAQIAYRTEKGTFATSIAALALGLPTSTNNYTYIMLAAPDGDQATIIATAIDSAAKGYSGGVVKYNVATGADTQSAIASIICEANTPGTSIPPGPIIDETAPTPELAIKCPSGETRL